MAANSPTPRSAGRTGILVGALVLVVAVILFALVRPPAPPPPPSAAVNAKKGPFDVLTAPPPANAPPETHFAANAPATAPAIGNAPSNPSTRSATTSTPTSPKTLVTPADQNALPPGHPKLSTGDEKTQVSLQWLGADCFYIQSPGGVAVVTDPFDPKTVGLPAASIGAHLVAVTAETPEHDAVDTVHAFQGAEKRVLHGEATQQGDLRVTPVRLGAGSATDTFAYVIDAGALRIAHLGGARGTLSADQIKQLGAVDILLLPVGDGSLTPADAVTIAKAVNPHLVIPMAYSTPSMPDSARKFRSVDAFVKASPYPRTDRDADVMLVSKADLPPKTEIWTLRYGH
jgi:L-ascorbate metabolism protein UlaG (beta-lactamase superfamily)